MSIRYWTATDQRNGRIITFSSKSKALDMLEFYKGAGIRCELAWDFFLLLSSSLAVGLSVTLLSKAWKRSLTSVTHNYVKLILLCASPQSEHTCPIRGIFMVIIITWTKTISTISNLITMVGFLLMNQQWEIQQSLPYLLLLKHVTGKTSKHQLEAVGI